MKLLIDISEHFDFLLIDLKFEIYNGHAFGSRSGIIKMRNDKIKIKIVSERNQTFIEVGSLEEEDWCELSILRYLIDDIPISFMNLEELSRFFKENFEKIESIYLAKRNISEIEELKYKVANKMI